MPIIERKESQNEEKRIEPGCIFVTSSGQYLMLVTQEDKLILIDLEDSSVYSGEFSHINHVINHMNKHHSYEILYESDYKIQIH